MFKASEITPSGIFTADQSLHKPKVYLFAIQIHLLYKSIKHTGRLHLLFKYTYWLCAVQRYILLLYYIFLSFQIEDFETSITVFSPKVEKLNISIKQSSQSLNLPMVFLYKFQSNHQENFECFIKVIFDKERRN